jgi:ADP-heptose:LPS heptosyltransferase
MLREDWKGVQRLLVIHAGIPSTIQSLRAAIQQFQQAIPQADLVLLCSPAAQQMALSLPKIADILVHEAVSEQVFSKSSAQWLDLVDELRSRKLDAVIVFCDRQISPYPLAYLCYLAEIPIRIGQSQEFGGGVLTEWVKREPEKNDHPVDLLNAVGLGTT